MSEESQPQRNADEFVAHLRSDEPKTVADDLRAAEEIERLREVVSEFEALIDDSHGVVGLHLNGDTADWDWLMDNEWLEKYQALQK